MPAELALKSKVRHVAARWTELRSYVGNNEGALIDFGQRYRANKPISISRAEGTINQLVNARINKRGRMRWSPEGAHCGIGVRASSAGRTLRPPGNSTRSLAPQVFGTPGFDFHPGRFVSC